VCARARTVEEVHAEDARDDGAKREKEIHEGEDRADCEEAVARHVELHEAEVLCA
jgi:predicted secreted Zn-dependent protease